MGTARGDALRGDPAQFGTLLDGLVVKNVDAVSAQYRKLCVEHMASVQPTAPFLMDFTETVVKLDGVGRKRCMELLTTFLGMSPEDDEVSQVILGVTLAAVTHLGLSTTRSVLWWSTTARHILEGGAL